MKLGLGIDIGGTNTKILLLRQDLKALKEIKIKTRSERGYSAFLKEIVEIVNSLKKEYKGIKRLSIGMAGDIDNVNGILRYSPNLNGWRNLKIAKFIEDRTSIKCDIENDANMAAWGAYILDLNRKYSNVAVLTLGTGIGGGLIFNGSLYRGFNGSAGEIGHMLIEDNGRLCGCGNRGCLEAYCGSKAIIKRAMDFIKNETFFRTKYGYGDEHRINTIALSKAAQDKYLPAIKIWDEVGHYLALGIGNILMILNPEVVVLTGGVSKAGKYFMPSLKNNLERFKIKTPLKAKILISKNADLGSFGCALFSMENQKK